MVSLENFTVKFHKFLRNKYHFFNTWEKIIEEGTLVGSFHEVSIFLYTNPDKL